MQFRDCSPFYSYLNLESTKTVKEWGDHSEEFYSYLNLESTKTGYYYGKKAGKFYSYLNLESTKTVVNNPNQY